MADSKISALTAKTAPVITDELVINDAGVNKKVAVGDLTEKGTFTPTLYGLTTAGTQTYTNQTGKYSRIGNIVYITVFIVMSAKDAATSGDLRLGGMPYPASDYSSMSISYLSNLTLTSSYFANGFIQTGSDYVRLFESNGTTRNVLQDTALTANTSLILSGCYQA